MAPTRRLCAQGNQKVVGLDVGVQDAGCRGSGALDRLLQQQAAPGGSQLQGLAAHVAAIANNSRGLLQPYRVGAACPRSPACMCCMVRSSSTAKYMAMPSGGTCRGHVHHRANRPKYSWLDVPKTK